MRKKNGLLLIIVLISSKLAFSQQYSLYKTGTLYDSFENPSQSVFVTDSSRRYAFNFLIPSTGVNAAAQGPALSAFKRLAIDGVYSTRSLSETETAPTSIIGHQNVYLLAFKMYRQVKYRQEIGFSWQLRSDTRAQITNQGAILFDDFLRLTPEVLNNRQLREKMFDTDAYSQEYHQFSFTWRENYNKRLAYGLKLSYLSGIYYGRVSIDRAEYHHFGNDAEVILDGKILTTEKYNPEKNMLYPGFKNPGLSAGFSFDYKLGKGFGLMGNLKDIGFISWSKSSYRFDHDSFSILASEVNSSLWERVRSELEETSYITPVNGKAEIAIDYQSKHYLPLAYISKNVFYRGLDIGMVNRLRLGVFNFSLQSNFNDHSKLRFGGQFMIKSPNVEFYIGSDQLLATERVARAFYDTNVNKMPGNVGGSVYLGFSLKFGRVMSRWQMDNYTPGIMINNDRKKGFLNRIFGPRY